MPSIRPTVRYRIRLVRVWGAHPAAVPTPGTDPNPRQSGRSIQRKLSCLPLTGSGTPIQNTSVAIAPRISTPLTKASAHRYGLDGCHSELKYRRHRRRLGGGHGSRASRRSRCCSGRSGWSGRARSSASSSLTSASLGTTVGASRSRLLPTTCHLGGEARARGRPDVPHLDRAASRARWRSGLRRQRHQRRRAGRQGQREGAAVDGDRGLVGAGECAVPPDEVPTEADSGRTRRGQ